MFTALNDVNWALFAPLIGLDIYIKGDRTYCVDPAKI